jgi:hypothetical protein
MIRFFCPVAPGALGDLPFAYLEALHGTGRALRAQSIGMAAFDAERRWYRLAHLFATPMWSPFVNVVCARPGLMLGTAMPVSALAPTRDSDTQAALGALERALGGPITERERLIYQPKTALVGLYTVGVKNVAITSAAPDPSALELEALARYDAVVTVGTGDRDRLLQLLGERHPRVVHVSPRASDLAALLDDLCGSSTSATGVPSRASHGRRATTSPPSRLPATTSRSSTGRAIPPAEGSAAPPPSRAFAISTHASSRGRAPCSARVRALLTTLRSAMGRLAFWRRWRARPSCPPGSSRE